MGQNDLNPACKIVLKYFDKNTLKYSIGIGLSDN